jgi:hypothetical protein
MVGRIKESMEPFNVGLFIVGLLPYVANNNYRLGQIGSNKALLIGC